MNLINKDKLIEGLKDKKYCKYCHYAGKENKCFYPSENSCSPVAMMSSIVQFINSLEVSQDEFRCEKKYTNDLLQMNYIAIMQKAIDEAMNKSPEEAKAELIRMGVLNEDGTPKENIVDR